MNPAIDPAALHVIIVGGGIQGCAVALRLAQAGVRTTLLERAVPGAEASSAAAGIIGPQVEAHEDGPLFELGLASRARFAAFVADVERLSNVATGYRANGVLKVVLEEPELSRTEAVTAWQQARGHSVLLLDGPGARGLEPGLSPLVLGGVAFPEDGQVDPARLLKATHIAALRAGVEVSSGAFVRRVLVEDDRATGIVLDDGRLLRGSHVVLAAGSWTTLIEGSPLAPTAVKPARGQIVELELPVPPIDRIVFGPGCYLVPRSDGRVLVGSTLEFVGYRREVTAGAVSRLLSAAIRLVPALEGATLTRSWSNFRPWTDRQLPYLGPSPVPGLLLATGHFRTGILLAAITADIIRASVLGLAPPVDLAPFSS